MNCTKHDFCIQIVCKLRHKLTFDGKLLVEQREVVLQLTVACNKDPLAFCVILGSSSTSKHLKYVESPKLHPTALFWIINLHSDRQCNYGINHVDSGIACPKYWEYQKDFVTTVYRRPKYSLHLTKSSCNANAASSQFHCLRCFDHCYLYIRNRVFTTNQNANKKPAPKLNFDNMQEEHWSISNAKLHESRLLSIEHVSSISVRQISEESNREQLMMAYDTEARIGAYCGRKLQNKS